MLITAQVLTEYVRRGDLTVHQAIKVVQDILFSTSNVLYNLNLTLSHLPLAPTSSITPQIPDLNRLLSFLDGNPSTKLLRLCYLDYTATPRMRVVPVQRALSVLQNEGSFEIGITQACLGLLQNDTIIPGVTATGEYKLHPVFSSIRPGPSDSYASIQCELLEQNRTELAICPRSILRRTVQGAKTHGLEFLLGFEIEVVFMSRKHDQESMYAANADSGGHAWNSARALQRRALLSVVNEIYSSLSTAGIHLETFHPESSTGQYEFVLPALPPLEAVDTLLQAREIICTIADRHSLRATLYPKPFPAEAGTAAHVHVSISSPNGEERSVYESFYAGVLRHLGAVLAFTYSNPVSYARMADSCWAGGRWVSWGTQNRETALRKIAGSHWEVKVLDGLANTYLAMAAIIAAGINGIQCHENLTWRDCVEDPATLSEDERKHLGIDEALPRDLTEAIDALRRDETLILILGHEAVERYIAVKKAEVAFLESMNGREQEQWMIERY
jgi:glutamine synthetase